MRKTIDFGIHLGLTNSSIAIMDGTRPTIIKNNDSMEYTPSVVYIDKTGNMHVGKHAKTRLEVEPEDAYAEFMLQMGGDASYTFKRSGRQMRPEDLSAEVLKSLRADVQQRLGEDLQAAVITVPAAFELPQCKATERAAQLAGLKFFPLIMEPIAAAMAHAYQSKSNKVFWLVYNLGGGTFDATVIQLLDGNFRIVNHAGDNHLGGKLIDWELVENLLAPAVLKTAKLTNFTRANPKWRVAFAKLKWAAEEAKIKLSNYEKYKIVIDFLCLDDSTEPVAFDFEITRADLARIAAPYIQRSVNIARQALSEAHLGPHDLEKVILVGGPTLAPYVREQLADSSAGLGIRLDFSYDPLTVVAQGAAIFAATLPIIFPLIVSPGPTNDAFGNSLSISSYEDDSDKAHEIFVSYSFVDRSYVEMICTGLERLGLKCWMAQRDIPPGGDWASVIPDAINHAQAFLLILSNSSNSSRQIAREVGLADKKGLPYFCVRTENVALSPKLSYYLGDIQWLDSFGTPSDVAIEKLAKAIRKII